MKEGEEKGKASYVLYDMQIVLHFYENQIFLLVIASVNIFGCKKFPSFGMLDSHIAKSISLFQVVDSTADRSSSDSYQLRGIRGNST